MWQSKEYQHLQTLEKQEDADKYFADQANFYFKKKKLERIDNFNGDFAFLNNDYPCDVHFDGAMYPNVFNAFQAARDSTGMYRSHFQKPLSVYQRHELSRKIQDPKDWGARRLVVMETLLRDKFKRHRDLRKKLGKTGRRELVNAYADESRANLFWGKVGKQGYNHLGRLLGVIRSDILENRDLDKWIQFCLDVQKEIRLVPEIDLTSTFYFLYFIIISHKLKNFYRLKCSKLNCKKNNMRLNIYEIKYIKRAKAKQAVNKKLRETK